jgi:replication factor C subunit 2/4
MRADQSVRGDARGAMDFISLYPSPQGAILARANKMAAGGSGGVASSQPWVEKYRPRKLDEVAHQDEVVKTLQRTVATGNLPHLLFYGPPGTGKTSTILALARELYGPEHMSQRVLELNASNERGIDVVRHRVKDFARIAVSASDAGSGGYPCPPFKIVILDEADSMTKDAQAALRRTMEKYSRVTRFCIICNYVSRIIDPLTSRCAKFRFKPLSSESMAARLRHIASNEGVRVADEAVDTLLRVSDGDLRKAITLLQSARRLVDGGASSSSSSSSSSAPPAEAKAKGEAADAAEGAPMVTGELVVEVAGVIPASVVERVLGACRSNSFATLEACANDVVAAGFPANLILAQLQALVVPARDLSDVQKAKICLRLAEAQKKLIDGADEFLQLLDVLSYSSNCIENRA